MIFLLLRILKRIPFLKKWHEKLWLVVLAEMPVRQQEDVLRKLYPAATDDQVASALAAIDRQRL